MNIRPLNDRVGIRRAEGDTKAGTIIPDSAEEPQGKVIAVCSGVPNESGAPIALDAKASYGKRSGTEVKIDGQNLIMKEAGIMGIIERAEAAKKAT